MNAISRRSLLARGGLLLAAGAAAVNTPVHALAANPQARSGNFKSIDMAMDQAVRDGTVAGVVATAAGPDSMIYEGTFGKANTVTGATMRTDTVFWLLSMTKAFTATACMQLIEQGRINPEDDAAKYLPQLANPMVLEGFDSDGKPRLRPAKRAIKVRHLLTHTSGYTYSIWSDALTRYENVTGMPDIATCKNGAFLAPLEFDPGERWQYGISMDWVGKLVEAVSDQSLEVYFRENIFAPLGMTDSGFLIGSKQKARVATFHNRREDGGFTPAPFEMPQRPEFFMGGGGGFSTPRDYMAFLRMLLNGGTHKGVRVLKPETVESMMRNQIGDLDVHAMRTAQPAYSQSFDQFPGEPHKWGYSFDINTLPGPNGRSAGSISWAGLLNCYFWLDPVRKVTGAIFTQLLPFYDEKVVKLYGTFERGLYDSLA
ncbi:beta-lactamase family protein [Mesorhizobium australicum]|uniref:Beta-lactamase family protein n=1 Tax=Mesorhizobium australicum TaxID=536018 RepID=A0ACC6T5D0_9HYPH